MVNDLENEEKRIVELRLRVFQRFLPRLLRRSPARDTAQVCLATERVLVPFRQKFRRNGFGCRSVADGTASNQKKGRREERDERFLDVGRAA